MEFKPFENDTQSTTIGNYNGVTFENGVEDIIMYGDTVIEKNESGVDFLNELIEQLQEIKSAILKKQ